MEQDEEPAPAELVEFGGAERPPSRWAAVVDRLLGVLTTQKAIAVGAAVILAAVVLSTVVASSDDGDGDTGSSAAEVPPTSPAPVRFSAGADEARTAPSTTWVGYRGVMLAVPSPWVQSADAGCVTTPAGWVAYPGSPPGDCPASAARDASRVTFHDDLGGLGELRRDASVVGRVAGRPLSATAMERTDGGVLQYLFAPGADLYVVIVSTCDDTTRAIVDSARAIPDDRVRVPELRGRGPLEAMRTIRSLGLVARVDHNSGEALPRDTVVADQNPIRGVVVKQGTEVSIAVRPAR